MEVMSVSMEVLLDYNAEAVDKLNLGFVLLPDN